MTTDSPSSRSTSGPSIHVVRARKLLFGGLAGGGAAALICLIILTVLNGTTGLASAALGAGMVLFFYAVGQLVMVRFADAGARTLLMVSLASYTGRVVILGLLLLIVNNNRDNWTAIDAMSVFITAVAVVVGWLVVEVFVFNRLRISIYDQQYESPAEPASETESADGADHDHLHPTTNGVTDDR